MSANMEDLSINNEKPLIETRIDPTALLPDEPMCFEIKKKKRKKKKKQDLIDPFKDVGECRKIIPPCIFSLDDDDDDFSEDKSQSEIDSVNIKLEIQIDVPNDDCIDETQDITTPETILDEYSNEIKVECDINDYAITDKLDDNILAKLARTKIKKEPKEDKKFRKIVNKYNIKNMCNICNLVFKKNKFLVTHQRRKHNIDSKNKFTHMCDYCDLSYQFKTSLAVHIKRKHGPDSVKPEDLEDKVCDICSLVFRGTTRLRLHKQRKHGLFGETFKFVCPECGINYEKSSSLKVHIRRKHIDKETLKNEFFKCKFCNKDFCRRESYSRHMIRKHSNSGHEDKAAIESLKSCVDTKTGFVSCKECQLVFSTLSSLKLHMRRKHNALKDKFKYKCRLCNLSYESTQSLKTHVTRKHNVTHFCKTCNKQYSSYADLLNHSHVKTAQECHLCGMIYANPGGLKKHLRCIHKLGTSRDFLCKLCNKSYPDGRLLKVHQMKVHIITPFACKYCAKTFKSKDSFRKHVNTKHCEADETKDEKQTCEKCFKSFTNELDLSKHILHEHNVHTDIINTKLIKTEDTDTKIFQCNRCEENYTTFNLLKHHYEKNHQVFEETQCQTCGKLVRTKDLEKHTKGHKHSEYKCKYCDYKCATKITMTKHILRHKNAETLCCTYEGCRYKTYYEDAMSGHVKRHDLQQILQCSRCAFQTMNKYILRYHEEAHVTGKKKYQCDSCDYATILPANLVQHKYKHSKEKRFKCEVCNFSTKYNTSLRFHVRKKHCDLPTST